MNIFLSLRALGAEDFNRVLEGHFPRGVSTREMVIGLETLAVDCVIGANQGGTFEVTYRALIMPEVFEGEEEVV